MFMIRSTAEVGVTRSVHDVDVEILVFEGGILRTDRDALLLFQVHGVHEALHLSFCLVGTEGTRLLQKAVHQRGFTVIHVCDDRNVTNMFHKPLDYPRLITGAAQSAVSREKVKYEGERRMSAATNVAFRLPTFAQ
jgi:hypothetical protein